MSLIRTVKQRIHNIDVLFTRYAANDSDTLILETLYDEGHI